MESRPQVSLAGLLDHGSAHDRLPPALRGLGSRSPSPVFDRDWVHADGDRDRWVHPDALAALRRPLPPPAAGPGAAELRRTSSGAMDEQQPLPTVDTVKEIIAGFSPDCCDLCGARHVWLYTESCKGCGKTFSPLCRKCIFFPKDTFALLQAGGPEKHQGICAHCVLEISSKDAFVEWRDPNNMRVLRLAKNNVQFLTWAQKLSRVWDEAERQLDEAVQMRQDEEM